MADDTTSESQAEQTADRQTTSQSATGPGPNPTNRTAPTARNLPAKDGRSTGPSDRNQHPVSTGWQEKQTRCTPLRVLCERCASSLAVFGGWWSVLGVMTAASIGAAKAGGYARYLESKTVVPERGDYYLTPDGEMAQAPGQWLASPETLARLGIEGSAVEGRDFIALMEGRHPRTGGWLRPEGAGGGRGGGIDLTFSAPKSVSAVWALGSEAQRRDMEAAHAAAVREAMAHLTETVPTVRRRYSGQVVEEPAREVVAAEYRHTTARGVLAGDAPGPTAAQPCRHHERRTR